MFHACTCSVGAALQRTRCSVWPDQRKYEKTMQVLCVCANTSWADTFWCIHMYTAGCTECAGTPCSPQSLKPLSWREGGEVGVAHCRPDLHINSPFVEICYIFVSIYGGDVFLSVRLPPLIVSFFFFFFLMKRVSGCMNSVVSGQQTNLLVVGSNLHRQIRMSAYEHWAETFP